MNPRLTLDETSLSLVRRGITILLLKRDNGMAFYSTVYSSGTVSHEERDRVLHLNLLLTNVKSGLDDPPRLFRCAL